MWVERGLDVTGDDGREDDGLYTPGDVGDVGDGRGRNLKVM